MGSINYFVHVISYRCNKDHFCQWMSKEKNKIYNLNIFFFQLLPKCPSTTRPSSAPWPIWATSWSRWTVWRKPSRFTRSSSLSPSRFRTRCLKQVHSAGWESVIVCWKDLTSHSVFTPRYGLFFVRIHTSPLSTIQLPTRDAMCSVLLMDFI